MPRTKGSKNKKTLEAEAQAGELLEIQKSVMHHLIEEQAKLEEEITSRRKRLQGLRKEMRHTAKEIERLTAMDIEGRKTADERELYRLVTELVESGKTSEDILKNIYAQ